MKLLSYCRMGETSFGIGKKDGVIDLGQRLKNKLPDKTISNFLSIFDFKYLERFTNLSVDYFYSDITFLPVIPNPNKILCIGLNYEKHRIETKREVSGYPTIFTRFPDTQVAHNQFLVKPNASNRFDFEGELAVIIGKGGRYISEDSAMDHIAGYSCYNDGSIRDIRYTLAGRGYIWEFFWNEWQYNRSSFFQFFGDGVTRPVHNEFFRVFLMNGVIGLMLFIFFFLTILY